MGEKIIKFIAGFRQGLGQAMVISPDRAYVRPATNGFQIDRANLSRDARKVGRDMKKKLKQQAHDEPSNQR
jgi:hypothetical protein